MTHATNRDEMTQMALDPNDRPRYSRDELHAYFTRIELPQKFLSNPIIANNDTSLALTSTHGLPLLRALHLHHLAHIPFENLELHYSAHRRVSLDMRELYAKFVVRGRRHGRGGRCMEQNGFFGTVLRSLGFDVRNAAGRVSRMWNPSSRTREAQGATFDGWNHMLNLVRLEGSGSSSDSGSSSSSSNATWWVVDVGMGSMGPGLVYPLREGFSTTAVAPRRLRLQLRAIPEHAARDAGDAPRLWCYDVCLKPADAESHEEDVWTPTYCFTETEFLPQDYEIMSWFTSTHPKSFFTYSVMCTRLLLDDAGDAVVGDITLFNNAVRKTVAGQREVLRELATEQDRLDALRELLGVELTEEEQKGISPEMQLSPGPGSG